MNDTMASVLLSLVRIAIRIEHAASMLLVLDDNQMALSLHDDPFLKPGSSHQMLPDLIELRTLLRETIPFVFHDWLVTMGARQKKQEEEEHEKAIVISVDERNRRRNQRVLNNVIVHGHLVALRSNMQAHELHAEVVSSVLSSFMYTVSKHESVVQLDEESQQQMLDLPYLFGIMARLRAMIVEWLNMPSRPDVEVEKVLNSVYHNATEDEKAYSWRQRKDALDKGRYVGVEKVVDGTTNELHGEEASNSTELNLQVLQVAAAGAVIKPLESDLYEAEEVKQALRLPLKMQGELNAALVESCKDMERYRLVGQDAFVEVWTPDNVLQRITNLNAREKEKQVRIFKCQVLGISGGEGGEQTQSEEEVQLTGLTSLVRDMASVSSVSSEYGRPLEISTREDVNYLQEHEMWISDLMALVPPALFEKDQDGKVGHRKLCFFLPNEVEPDAHVVHLQGVLQSATTLELMENGEEVDPNQRRYDQKTRRSTYKDRYCAILYEAYCYKWRNMVQIYRRESHGRHYYRTLVYTTQRRFSLHYFPHVNVGSREMAGDLSAWGTGPLMAAMTGKVHEKYNRRRAVARTQGVAVGLEIDPMCKRSVVVVRKAPTLGLPGVTSSTFERYIPQRFLFGLLPDTILKQYDFYREEADVADLAGASEQLVLRGYPIRHEIHASYEEDLKLDLDANVILVMGKPTELYAFGLPDHEHGPPSSPLCRNAVVVLRFYLDKMQSSRNAVLLNVLSEQQSEHKTPLHILTNVLTRLENLSHILAWSYLHGENVDQLTTYGIDLVELPRLQLSFNSKEIDGAMALASVELPHLHIFAPKYGVWPDDVLRLVEGVPHGLLMLSETQQMLLLVPNVRIAIGAPPAPARARACPDARANQAARATPSDATPSDSNGCACARLTPVHRRGYGRAGCGEARSCPRGRGMGVRRYGSLFHVRAARVEAVPHRGHAHIGALPLRDSLPKLLIRGVLHARRCDCH